MITAPGLLISLLLIVIASALGLHAITLYAQVTEPFLPFVLLALLALKKKKPHSSPPPQKPKPKPVPIPPPPPPPPVQFKTDFSGTVTDNIINSTNRPCSIYYTPYKQECDLGLFSTSSNELKRMYSKDKQSYNMIMDERKNMPEPGVCKITLNNWESGPNAPVINAKDPTNVNRGAPSTWAYCFQPLANATNLALLKTKITNTKSIDLTDTVVSNVYGSNDTTSYARISFSNFNYTDIKSDVCTKLKNIGQNITVASNLIGITVDTSMTVKYIGIYNYNNNVFTENIQYKIVNRPFVVPRSLIAPKVIMPLGLQRVIDDVYSKLFEEKLVPSKTTAGAYDLVLEPKSTPANILKFDIDICGQKNLNSTVQGVLNISDFKIKPYTLNASVKEGDLTYGLLSDLKDKRDQLQSNIASIEEENRSKLTSWKCFDGILAPIRRNDKGDIECISTDGSNCNWQADKDACEELIRDPPVPSELEPLTCGKKFKQLYGFTGYDRPTHWCAVGKKELNKSYNTQKMRAQLKDLDTKINTITNTKRKIINKAIIDIVKQKIPYRTPAEVQRIGGNIGIPSALKSGDGRIYIQLG